MIIFFLGVVFGEFIKVHNTDKYIGLDGANLVLVGPERAASIIRREAGHMNYETLLEIHGLGMADFNRDNFAIVNEYNRGARFSVTMADNGFFVLIVGAEDCLYELDNTFRRGRCDLPGNVTFFEITPVLLPSELLFNNMMSAGLKDMSFNPDDPLDDSWSDIPTNQKMKVLYPYKERLRGAVSSHKLDAGKDYTRIFYLHPPSLSGKSAYT